MMFRFARNAVAVAAGLILAASVATAGLPDPTGSVTPDTLVGHSSRWAPTNRFPLNVQVKGINQQPVAGATVVIHFTSAGLEQTHAYADQAPPIVVGCPANTLTLVTDGQGWARFYDLLYGGFNVNSGLVTITADGILIKTLPATSTDYNADGICNAIDLAVFHLDLQNFPNALRSDFNRSSEQFPTPAVDAVDLAILGDDLQSEPIVQAFCP